MCGWNVISLPASLKMLKLCKIEKSIRVTSTKILENIVFHKELLMTGMDYPRKLPIHLTYYHLKLN